ncbi:hypothetical protein ACFQDG_13065 [Natronoarchaeum mannanilyticum]|uniref:Halobacterial output domain-containing protein n=1 Tax=Natronoarchaeum mannanilyticum TaxID=926360 RepID=A0AAV3T8Y5_9EURY
MDGTDGNQPSPVDPGETELVYRSDGRIELRVQDAAGQWITTDSPVEVRR